MDSKRVLYLGIEPSLLDPASMPGVDVSTLMAGIRAVLGRLEEHGYEARWCPVDLGETAEATVAAELERQRYACVVIGAGIRQGPPFFTLFERLINVVHARAPGAKICFNTRPGDTLEAVQRWI
jgi:hypothetical protein